MGKGRGEGEMGEDSRTGNVPDDRCTQQQEQEITECVVSISISIFDLFDAGRPCCWAIEAVFSTHPIYRIKMQRARRLQGCGMEEALGATIRKSQGNE